MRHRPDRQHRRRWPGRARTQGDNFATIVRAASVGRKVYHNMLKQIRFMLVALVPTS
jgi:hypothetical protein